MYALQSLAEQRITMARMDPELHVTLLNGGLTAFCYQVPTFASYVHQRKGNIGLWSVVTLTLRATVLSLSAVGLPKMDPMGSLYAP